MTRPDFLAALATLGWTIRGLARVLGRPENTVRNWTRTGYRVPPDVAAWLVRRLAAHEADPPPSLPHAPPVALRVGHGVLSRQERGEV